MSRTFELGCDDCGVCLWIGQSGRVYTAEPHATNLSKFVVEHTGHRLRVLDTELVPETWNDVEEVGHQEQADG